MKGKTPTKAEREYWDKVAALGCIACLKDGIFNDLVSIHHTEGRTKPGAHMKVLPLCGPHHQHDDTDPMSRIGVHPYKAAFEERYGRQEDLVEEVRLMTVRRS